MPGPYTMQRTHKAKYIQSWWDMPYVHSITLNSTAMTAEDGSHAHPEHWKT